MSSFPHIWGQRIRTTRRALGMTQVQLAEAAGVAQQLISIWENGHVAPRDVNRVRLARALGVEPGWLFSYEIPAPTNGDIEAA